MKIIIIISILKSKYYFDLTINLLLFDKVLQLKIKKNKNQHQRAFATDPGRQIGVIKSEKVTFPVNTTAMSKYAVILS